MTWVEPSSPGALARSRLFLGAILVVATLLLGVAAVLFQAPEMIGHEKVLTDFDAFHIAGTMAIHGHAADAYQAAKMIEAQYAIAGTRSFMPWTYPPPYTLAMMPLAHLPVGAAFLLFVSASFLFYLHVLRRIAGEYLPGVLIAILPTLVLILRTGQNGFLTASLIGCFLLAFQQKRTGAGIPLGLMVIKPHLAAGIALLALLGRRWSVMAIAAAVVIAAVALSTAVFGIRIWPAFVGGVEEASGFLAKRYYPLFRMSSIYACVGSLGGSPKLAMMAHGIVALGGVGFLLHAWRRGYAPRRLAAVACAVSLLISPYNYDYDLTILGLAIAFVLKDLVELARPYEMLALCALSWFVTGYGLGAHTARLKEEAVRDLAAASGWSLTAPALLLLIIAGHLILRRGDGEAGVQQRQ